MTPTPSKVVQKPLQHSLHHTIVKEIVAPDAVYSSLTLDNPELKKILSYNSVRKNRGPEAGLKVIGTVNKIWTNEDFRIYACFDDEKNMTGLAK